MTNTLRKWDADGGLAAIQGWNQRLAEELKRRDVENAGMKRQVEEFKQPAEQLRLAAREEPSCF